MAENNYSYSGDNVKDYAQSITDQYGEMVKDQNTSVDTAVKAAESHLGTVSSAGDDAAKRNLRQAQSDLKEAYRTRDALWSF